MQVYPLKYMQVYPLFKKKIKKKNKKYKTLKMYFITCFFTVF